jgi:hypothetical protein
VFDVLPTVVALMLMGVDERPDCSASSVCFSFAGFHLSDADWPVGPAIRSGNHLGVVFF